MLMRSTTKVCRDWQGFAKIGMRLTCHGNTYHRSVGLALPLPTGADVTRNNDAAEGGAAAGSMFAASGKDFRGRSGRERHRKDRDGRGQLHTD
jgi:hypothetical protein